MYMTDSDYFDFVLKDITGSIHQQYHLYQSYINT